jgi:LPS-assembly protein
MRRTIRMLGLCLIVMAFLFPAKLPAESNNKNQRFTSQEEQNSGYRLRADSFSYDKRQDIYTASGNVVLHAKGSIIFADHIRLDAVSREAIAEGDVRIERDKDWLEGEKAYLNLEKETGLIKDGRGFLADGNFHFSGALVEKLGPQTYNVVDGTFTTCDGDEPSWHFRTSDLKVTLEGYGFAKDTSFYLGRVPVLYSPYLAFPAKTKRQTGLLMPRFGVGDRLGYDFDLPFFWAISRSTDATIYSHYMSKRGLMMGPEFRYAASTQSKGELRFNYLDDQASKHELEEEYYESAAGLRRITRDRWWWRSKQDLVLPSEVRGNLDLDFVSDPDYLRAFNTGYSSWRESDKEFRDTFGRGLINDPTVTTRESVLLLNKSWATQSANLQLHYYQNLNSDEDQTQLQQLPVMSYSASSQPIFGGPFFINANAGYVNYWRPEGTRGNRLNASPRLSLPLRRGGYLQLEPYVSYLGTLYLIDRYDEPADSKVKEKTFQSRELFETGIEGSTEIVRIFEREGETWTKTKHTMRPNILYEYRPEVSQNKLPFFDQTDRINSRNRLTYSLTNFFSARLDQGPDQVEYLDVARLEFRQHYDISQPQGGAEDLTTTRKRPFSNVFMQLDLTPKRYISLTYKNELSLYDKEFTSHNLLANLWDERGDKLNVSYQRQLDRDEKTVLDEIDAKLGLKLWDGVSVNLRTDYRLDTNKKIKNEYNLIIERQCWGISFSYVDQPDDQRFAVGIKLYGVGKLGTQTF